MDILRTTQKEAPAVFPMKTRIVYKGAIYHITQRAPGRERVFVEDQDYLYFLKLLKNAVQKFEIELFAFALLPNHLHLLVQIKQTNLSLGMKNLFERYAKYFNEKYLRKGHVFCGRYRASLCQDDSYFLTASLYIHMNPSRAGLCEDPRNYRWSSVALYTDDRQSTFITSEKALALIDKDPKKARQQYDEILSRKQNSQESALWDSRSVRTTLEAISRAVMETIRKKEKADLDQLILNFKEKRRLQGDEDRRVRKYVIEQLLARGYSVSGIQKELNISRPSLYRIVKGRS